MYKYNISLYVVLFKLFRFIKNKNINYAVWKELEKENKEFFEAYSTSKNEEGSIMSEAETSEMIQKLISDSPFKDSKD